MGFLDNLVSDLVKSSTGINARGFVRTVGGKNILLLGGAAVAGALAANHLGKESSSPSPPPVPGGEASVPPPPPPPVLTTEATPSLPPPIPGAAPETTLPDGAEAIPHDLLWAIVRTMVAAALSDGRIAAEEKALIEKRLDSAPTLRERVGQVHNDLLNPPSQEELARHVSNREDAELLYRFASLVVLADKNVSEPEKTWLEQFATALEIPSQRREILEWEIFL
jgi:tellurite resistance protein